MSVCCVKKCFNNFYNNKNVKFYRFPIYKRRDSLTRKQLILRQRMEWIRVLKDKSSITMENIHTKRVCSAHFNGKKAQIEDVLNPDWSPWRNLDGEIDDSQPVATMQTSIDFQSEFKVDPEDPECLLTNVDIKIECDEQVIK